MIVRAVVLFLGGLLLAVIALAAGLLGVGDDLPQAVAWLVFALVVLAVAALLFPLADALWRIHLPHPRRRPRRLA